jgi:hypothetical protein
MKRRIIVVLAVLALVAVGAVARAESASEVLEKGIYTEETVGNLNDAINLYQQVVNDLEANRAVLAQAHYRLASCYLKQGDKTKAVAELRRLVERYGEDTELAAEARALLDSLTMPDPASLMPAETFLYIEAGSPGKHAQVLLDMLKGSPLENPLPVLGRTAQEFGMPEAMVAALLNPDNVQELSKVRGYALGMHGVNPDGPPFMTFVLYPGESNFVRGLFRLALEAAAAGNAAQPGEPVEGMQVTTVGGPRGVAFAIDENAILLATPPAQLKWCIRQYKGVSDEPSLATASEGFARVDRATRQRDAVTAWVGLSAILPQVMQMASQGGAGAQMAAADAMAGLSGVDGLVVRHVLDARSPYLEAVATWREGTKSLAYDLVRTPPVTAGGFGAVPPEALAVLSFSLNAPADGPQAAAASDALKRLTGMDIGREVFANIQQVTLFVVPPTAETLQHPLASENPLVPTVGIAVTSRDPATTRAVVDGLLDPVDTTVRRLTGMAPRTGGEYIVTVQNSRPVALHVGQAGNATVLALAPQVVEAAAEAARTGESVASAGPLAEAIGALPDDASKVLLVSVGRLCEVAGAYAEAGNAPPQVLQILQQLGDIAAGTQLYLFTGESPDRLAARVGVSNLPPLANVFPLVVHLGAVGGRAAAAAAGSAGLPEAPLAPEPVDIPYNPSEVTVDADLTDWEAVAPMPLPFMGRDAGMVRLSWREDGLYAALKVEDDSIAVNLREPWTGDAFELWVDSDFTRDVQYAGGGAEQYVFTYDSDADGGRAPLMIVYGPNQGREPEVRSAWRRTDEGYVLEVRIPAGFLADTDLAEGTVMGLNFAVDDDGRATEQFYVDKDDRQAYGTPALWGAVRLARL